MVDWSRWTAAALVVAAVFSGGCDEAYPTVETGAPEEVGNAVPSDETPLPTPVLTPPQTPDAGQPGPWPVDPVRDYSRDFDVGTPQSVGLDEGLNLWLLDGDRVGVLRPGDRSPRWARGIGQARAPFGEEGFALGSTVICGGEAGRAYVGYRARELQKTIPERLRTYIPGPGEPYYTPERYAEYQKGDMDAVRLAPDGSIILEEHLWRTTGASNRGKQLGIHNTNDFHFDEDRSVLACQRVTRGPYRGDVYITTNHGVTRVQGLFYNSHRHPGWYRMVPQPDGSLDPQLQTPPMHGLGIAVNGDVLVANEQMVGVLVPSPKLEEWDREQTWEGPTPWRFRSFNHVLSDQETPDHWRAFEQALSGRYYLGSAAFGLWSLHARTRSSGEWTKIAGLPTDRILALKATDDGALYVGTDGAGLWRLEADGRALTRITAVSGQRVLQLVYEPTVTPRMLLVLTEAGLTVLRGP